MNAVTVNIRESINRLRAIEEKKNDLITKVVEFFDARGESPKDKVPVERSQLQNLLRLALSTSSIKEIQLFIRYQRGRHEEWKKQNFGETLERVIGEIGNIDHVRLFLGYFVREARFRRPD